MRASFVLSEIGSGLRRNVTMTLAVVLTSAICLALLGTALLLGKQIEIMKGYWYDRVEVSLFLREDATLAQRTDLGADLTADPLVERVFFESKPEAFARFREQFKDYPDITEGVTAADLQESYRVKLQDPQRFAEIQDRFGAAPGVDTVVDQRKYLKGFFRVINDIKLAALVIAAVQAVAALVLIANTIRVAAFSRRRETGIMRLVGASSLSIRLPFVLEGVLAAVAGAVLAIGVIVGLKVFFLDAKLSNAVEFLQFSLVGWPEIWSVVPLLLLFAVALGGITSAVTLRRHLRV
jgi:cell division transport system permease protein